MRIIPPKYTYLVQAEQAGLCIPQGICLDSESNYVHQLATWLQQQSAAKRYIVRSAMQQEDREHYSFAGYFFSSAAVDKTQVKKAVLHAIQENQQRLNKLNNHHASSNGVQLMVQEYIEHRIGGVLFTPWSFFHRHVHIEYTTKGVQAVVAGQAKTAILHISAQPMHPVPLTNELDFLTPLLLSLAQQLQSCFPFAIDCEWAYCQQRQSIVVLQIRPQTHLSGPIFGRPPQPPQMKSTTLSTEWQYSTLSDSLGRLSPLSFSLLQQLYRDSRTRLQYLGCQAKQVDFLCAMPDGTVLTSPKRERDFFQLTTFGGFWRGLRSHSLQQQIQQYWLNWPVDSNFSYMTLSQLFNDWLTANMLSQGAKRNLPFPSHSYELTWYIPQTTPAPQAALQSRDWAQYHSELRTLFFFELGKLKATLQFQRDWAFATWQAYLQQIPPDIHAQTKQACAAIYDYALNPEHEGATMEMRSLAAKQSVTAPAFIIEHPHEFRGVIPTGSLLVTPYFNNHWVAQIPQLAGILVSQGGNLSHSALVARENNIPYCVIDAKHLATLRTGDMIHLVPSKQHFEHR